MSLSLNNWQEPNLCNDHILRDIYITLEGPDDQGFEVSLCAKRQKKEREHKDDFTMTLSQWQLLQCFHQFACPVVRYHFHKKIHLALISNERHEKGLIWKNVPSGRRSFQTKCPLRKVQNDASR